MRDLWLALRDLFAKDDGSLPEIWIAGIESGCLNATFERLREAGGWIPSSQTIWLKAEDQELPLASIDQPARLVQDGRADSFHCTVRDARWRNEELPDLGIFVYRHGIDIDYRMGPEWTAAAIAALIDLLGYAAKASNGARIQLWDAYPPEIRERGEAAIREFLRRQ
jgi:hypothetical protein